MITANDYQRGLFNGDQGIVVRADEGLGRHHFRAVFRVSGRLVPFAIEALRDRLELAWALTVHKSQGSEVDAVVLVLPHDDLPLVTRELLYTAHHARAHVRRDRWLPRRARRGRQAQRAPRTPGSQHACALRFQGDRLSAHRARAKAGAPPAAIACTR